MTVISFINEKGGVGKSTSALALAAELARFASVVILDADTQLSLHGWSEKGKRAEVEDNPPVLVCTDSELIEMTIDHLSQKFDYLLVDTRGGLSGLTGKIAARSDMVITPMKPDPLSEDSTLSTIRAVRALGDELDRTIPHRVLITDLQRGEVALGKANRRVLERVRSMPQAFKQTLYRSNVYSGITEEGKKVRDLGNNNATQMATTDLFNLMQEVVKELQGVPA